MTRFSYLILGLILLGCHPFEQDQVITYEADLIEIIDVLEEFNNVILEYDSVDRIAADMSRLGINYIVKNITRNNRFSGF